MIVVGVDIGVTGAIAVLETQSKAFTLLDLPTMSGVGARRILGPIGALAIFNSIAAEAKAKGCKVRARIEKLHAMPLGSLAAFSKGDSYGVVRTALTAANIPFHAVDPRAWMRTVLGDYPKERKLRLEDVRAKARELYPESGKMLSRVRDHDRAAALLIAHTLAMEVKT